MLLKEGWSYSNKRKMCVYSEVEIQLTPVTTWWTFRLLCLVSWSGRWTVFCYIVLQVPSLIQITCVTLSVRCLQSSFCVMLKTFCSMSENKPLLTQTQQSYLRISSFGSLCLWLWHERVFYRTSLPASTGQQKLDKLMHQLERLLAQNFQPLEAYVWLTWAPFLVFRTRTKDTMCMNGSVAHALF